MQLMATRSLQPTAAAPSVFGGLGRFAAFWLRPELGSPAAVAEGER